MVIPFRTISNIINLTSNALRGVNSAVSIQDRLQQQAERKAKNEAQNNALATSNQPVKTNLILDPQVVKLFMQKQEFDRELLEIKQKELELKEFQFEAYLKVETARDEREQERNKIERRKAEILEAKRRDEIELSKLHRGLMRELQRQEIEQRKNEVEANWDQVNWFSSLSKEETKEILVKNQERPRLLVLLAPLSIAASCPFQEDLPDELEHELRIFLRENYSLDDDFRPVQFYGGYFKRPITDAELDKLKLVLSPVSTVIIQTKITSSKVLINVGFWDFQSNNVLHIPIKPWNWLQMKESLAEEGISENKQNILVQEFITSLHKVLCAYITDAYYLSLDPYYEPQLFNLQDEFSQIDETGDFLDFYLQRLQNNRQEKIAVYEREIKMQQQKQVWNCVNSFTGFVDSLYSTEINNLISKTNLFQRNIEIETIKISPEKIQIINNSIKISPDNKSILHGKRLLEMPSGRLLRLLENKGQYSPNGKYVYSVSRNLTKLYNSHTGTLVDNLPGELVAFDETNEIVFLQSKDIKGDVFTKVWDLTTKTVKFTFPGSYLVFTKTTKILITTHNKSKLTFWNLVTGEKIGENQPYCDEDRLDFALLSNEKYIFIANYQHQLILEIETVKTILAFQTYTRVDISNHLLVIVPYNKTEVWNTQTGEVLYSLPGINREYININSVYNLMARFNKNNNDASIEIRDLATGKLVEKIEFSESENFKYIKFSSNNKYLIVCFQYHVYVWECVSWKLLHKIQLSEGINGIRTDINDNSKFLLDTYPFSYSQFAFSIYSLDTQKKLFDVRNLPLNSIIKFKDNLLVTTINNFTQTWDIETGEEVFNHEPLQLYCPKNQTLVQEMWNEATATCDIAILDPETKELLQILPGHSGSIQQIEFSQDGQTMVSVGGDLKIKVWQKEREALPDE